MDKKYYYKVEIEIDEEKVIADHKYSLEKMYSAIRNIFIKDGLREIQNGKTLTFIGDNTDEHCVATNWNAVALYKKQWCKPYVKTLRWYDNTDNEEYFEDIKETIDQKYKGA